jgi:hypothetical protein
MGRMKQIITVCLTVTLMLGCSSRLAYNNLDWLASWYLDDYVELTEAQENVFQLRLTEVLDWHRKEELEQYRQHLLRLKQDVSNQPLSSIQWATYLQDLRNHWTMIRFQVSLKLVDLAIELKDAQVDDFFQNLKDKNQKDRAEFLELSSEERAEAMINNVEDAVEDRIGNITPEQKLLINDFVVGRDETRLGYLDYTAQLQDRAKELVKNRKAPSFSEKLLKVISEPEQFQRQEYRQKVQANRDKLIEFLVALNQSMTTKQTNTFISNINELVETIESLQGKEG